MDLCEECCFTVTMTPTMKSAKATLNSSVWSSPHWRGMWEKCCRTCHGWNAGLTVMDGGYGVGNTVGGVQQLETSPCNC